MSLESIGKVLGRGFGDRVIVGIFVGYLSRSTPKGCYEWIRDKRSLLDDISDRDWAKCRRLVKGTNVDLSKENILNELRKSRIDLLGVILNTPGGKEWLDTQIMEIKKKLELE